MTVFLWKKFKFQIYHQKLPNIVKYIWEYKENSSSGNQLKNQDIAIDSAPFFEGGIKSRYIRKCLQCT